MEVTSPKIKPARSIFFELVIACVTLSFYLLFWFYQAIRDLKNITNRDLAPGAWFFVPLFLPAQFFAIPYFIKELKAAETKLVLPSWPSWLDWTWIIANISLSLATVTIGYVVESLIIEIAVLLAWIIAVISISGRLSRIREKSALPKTKPFGPYSIFEWPFVVIIMALIIYLAFVSANKAYEQNARLLPDNTYITNDEHNFAFSLHGETWEQVEIGTVSDGSAVDEYSAHSGQASLMFFLHSDVDDITGYVQFRVEESKNDISRAQCEEYRTLSPNTYFIVVSLACEGYEYGDKSLNMYQYVQTSATTYVQAHGSFVASDAQFDNEVDAFKATFKSVALLDAELANAVQVDAGDSEPTTETNVEPIAENSTEASAEENGEQNIEPEIQTALQVQEGKTALAAQTKIQTDTTDLIALAKQIREMPLIRNQDDISRLLYDVKISIGQEKATYTYTKIWHYPDEKSIEENAFDSMFFISGVETITESKALILKPNDEVEWVDTQNAATTAASTFNSLVDSKKQTVDYANLTANSVSLIQYTIESDLTQQLLPWSKIYNARTTRAAGIYQITLEMLDDKDISFDTLGDHVKCQQTDNTISCKGQNIPAIPEDDSMVFRDHSEQIVFSEISQWSELSAVVNAEIKKAGVQNENVADVLNTIVKSTMDIEEKIDAVHQFVSNEIKAGPELNEGEAKPTPALHNDFVIQSVSQTIAKRSGSYLDKTALLIHMLSQIGVGVEPMLVSTLRRAPERLIMPAANYFNHLVTCFTYLDEYRCIDTSYNSSDWRYIPAGLMGEVALMLKSDALPSALPVTNYPYVINNTIDLKLLQNGDQSEVQTIHFDESYANFYRSIHMDKTQEERDIWAVDVYTSYVASDPVPSATIKGVDKLQSPITMQTNNHFAELFVPDEDLSIVEYEPWINFEVNAIELENKYYPVRVLGSKVVSRVNVEIPGRWSLMSYPPDLNISTDYLAITRKVTRVDKRNFYIETEFTIPSRNVLVEEQAEMLGAIAMLQKQSMIKFTADLKQ
jgi:hypothetical protein